MWLVGADGTVQLKPITVARYQDNSVVVGSGLAQGEIVVTAGVQKLVPGEKVRLMDGKCRAMTGFNLSEWAINHRSFVWYLMIIFVVAGILSYTGLGREEDPAFTIKTMIVQTLLAGRHGRGHPAAGHRPDRKETAGNAIAVLPEKLYEARNLDRLRQFA